MMIGIVLLFSFLSVANAGPPSRIIGGWSAPNHKYKFLVSLRDRSQGGDNQFCAGSIISEKFILTAAHCTGRVLKGNDIWAVAGSNLLDESGDSYKIDKALIHEKYVDFKEYDIALLRIQGTFRFNEFVSRVNLPKENFIEYGLLVGFAGWGDVMREQFGKQEQPDELQEVLLQVITNEECRKFRNDLTERHLCTYNEGHQEGFCDGDSGGPLVVEGVQVGIASYIKDCIKTAPDIFTRVFSYVDWIEEVMVKNA